MENIAVFGIAPVRNVQRDNRVCEGQLSGSAINPARIVLITASGIPRHGAVRQRQRAVVVVNPTSGVCGIFRNCRVRECHLAVADENSAAVGCGIPGNFAVRERQRAGVGIVNPAAVTGCGIFRDGRVDDCQRAAVAVNPAAVTGCGIFRNGRVDDCQRAVVAVNPAAGVGCSVLCHGASV